MAAQQGIIVLYRSEPSGSSNGCEEERRCLVHIIGDGVDPSCTPSLFRVSLTVSLISEARSERLMSASLDQAREIYLTPQ